MTSTATLRALGSVSAEEAHAARALNYGALKQEVIGEPPPPEAPSGYRYHFRRDTDPRELIAIVRKSADDDRFAKLTVDERGLVTWGKRGRPAITQRARYVLDPVTGKPKKLDTHGAQLDEQVSDPLLQRRAQAMSERDAARQAGDKVAANKAQGRANRATEALGVQGAKAYMKARDPGAELVMQSRGTGSFDLVYRPSQRPPEFVLIEAKGGTGSNTSSRKVGDEQVQQGRPEYAADVAEAMRNRGGESKGVGIEIEEALEVDEVEYLEVTTPVNASNVQTPRIRQYDLSVRLENK